MNKQILEIDRQSYIQKNKIMACWKKLFGIDFGGVDADELSFGDLLDAVWDRNREQVYAALHEIVNHGVTSQQKKFLYEYSAVLYQDDGMQDFDNMLPEVSTNFDKVGIDHVFVAVSRSAAADDVYGCYFYSARPVPRLEYFFYGDGTPLEAILVQNGFILVINDSDAQSAYQRLNKMSALYRPLEDEADDEEVDDDYEDDD